MKISFSGIYDVRFPAGTKDEVIQKKYLDAKSYAEKNYSIEITKSIGKSNIVDVRLMDRFDTQKTDKKLAEKGIRISSPIDNPWILCDIFEHIDEDLSQQYVNKAKVELVLDKQA